MTAERRDPARSGRGPVDDVDSSQGTDVAEAAEVAIESVPEAVSLAPSSGMPALGGELVLPAPDGSPVLAEGELEPEVSSSGTESVRAALFQAGPLALAGLLANGANVVITILLARMLTNRGYGAFNQLNGLFLVVSMPGSAVIVAVVRRVTAWRGRGSAHLVCRWARVVHRQGSGAVIVFALVVIGMGPLLAGLLNQPSIVGLDAMLIAGAVWVLLCLDRGLLQAHRSYHTLAANLLVEGGMRAVAVLLLVGAGGGVTGAAVGVLIAELVTAAHARITADRAWAAEVREEDARGEHGIPRHLVIRGDGMFEVLRRRWSLTFRADRSLLAPSVERRDLGADLLSALLALALVALLQNIDVIVIAKEAPAKSGSYAAVSVTAKALVFGAIVLGGYLLPEAAIRWRQGGHALRQLGVTLGLLAIPAALLLFLAVGVPHLFLTLVFSARYLGAEHALAPLVLAMAFLALTVMMTMYLLAIGRRWISWLLLAGGALATWAVASAHGVPRATAIADLSVQAGLAIAVGLGFVTVHQKRFRRH